MDSARNRIESISQSGDLSDDLTKAVGAVVKAGGAPSAPADSPDTSLALILLREMRQSVYMMDPDGRITLINPAGLLQLDLDHHAQAHGRFWWNVWPAVPAASLKSALADACEGETVRMDARCPATGGREADARVVVCPIDDGSGGIGKVLAIAHFA